MDARGAHRELLLRRAEPGRDGGGDGNLFADGAARVARGQGVAVSDVDLVRVMKPERWRQVDRVFRRRSNARLQNVLRSSVRLAV